jgi:hypothetical protein
MEEESLLDRIQRLAGHELPPEMAEKFQRVEAAVGQIRSTAMESLAQYHKELSAERRLPGRAALVAEQNELLERIVVALESRPH